jgi:hypothetical protein
MGQAGPRPQRSEDRQPERIRSHHGGAGAGVFPRPVRRRSVRHRQGQQQVGAAIAAHLQDHRTINQAIEEGLSGLVRDLRQELALLRLEAEDIAGRAKIIKRRDP